MQFAGQAAHNQYYVTIVIPQRKIPARDWSKSRHVTFTNTP